MCVETLRTGCIFLWWLIWGSHASVYSKYECFLIYLLGNHINVCWNPRNRACFSKMIDLRDHMPRFTLKLNMFFHLSHWKPHKCVLKPSEQGSFFWDDWFEGHMLRFTLKMNVIPSISLEIPSICVETLRTGHIDFLRWLIGGVTCLGLF